MDIGGIWQQAAGKWNEVIAGVGEDQRSQPCATCPGWTIGDLVDHVMKWQAQGASMLVDIAPDASWDEVQAALVKGLADPATLEGGVEQMGGMPKQQVAGFLVGDLLVHSWDLARTIGADESLPLEAVQSTMTGLQRVPDKALRSETMFGPPVEVGADASPQDQLLAFLGRQP